MSHVMPPKLFAQLASSPTMPLSPVLSSIEQGRRPSATLTGQPLPLSGSAARTVYVPPACTQLASVCTLARGPGPDWPLPLCAGGYELGPPGITLAGNAE